MHQTSAMINNLKELVANTSVFSKDRSKKYGEVFTPAKIISEMCDALPIETWTDPSKTILDPCAGRGNFPAEIAIRLMKGLENIFPDEKVRYKHIMEKQIYMCELRPENVQIIERIFNPDGKLKLNIYMGDSLKMPDDYFDLNHEERQLIYPDNTSLDCITCFNIKTSE